MTPKSTGRSPPSPPSSRSRRSGRVLAGLPTTSTVTTWPRSIVRLGMPSPRPGRASSSLGLRRATGWLACRRAPTDTSSRSRASWSRPPLPNWRRALRNLPPYPTVLKPYGRALVELARVREDVLCLSGDLTRQTEIDLFQDEFPERFIHAGMAEANMISMAGALARRGFIPFVHTFGVFATRRPLDQIVNSVAYPNLPVRIVGFMPRLSSPGGPSHQAIEDVAIMRSLPNMTVIDVADATEIRQAVSAIVDLMGPVYLRLKRGEIPLIFDARHQFSLERAHLLHAGEDVVILSLIHI